MIKCLLTLALCLFALPLVAQNTPKTVVPTAPTGTGATAATPYVAPILNDGQKLNLTKLQMTYNDNTNAAEKQIALAQQSQQAANAAQKAFRAQEPELCGVGGVLDDSGNDWHCIAKTADKTTPPPVVPAPATAPTSKKK